MNHQTCPDAFCGGSLRDGACMVCGQKWPDLAVTLTDAVGNEVSLDGVTWPVMASSGAVQELRELLERARVLNPVIEPVFVVAKEAIGTESVTEIYAESRSWDLRNVSVHLRGTGPGKYSWPSPKRGRRK